MSPEDRRAIAYHEAGHAVAGFYLRPEDRILKASIIRRGGTLGVIGPTRMAYERVIPIVEITAKLLSNALTAQYHE